MHEGEKREKEPSTIRHKILTVIGIVLCIILIPILIINCTLIFKSYSDPDKVPNVGGIFPMIVLTDSMYPEIESGDLIICHTINAQDIKAGDIISFFDPAGNGVSVVTHRVVEVTTDENGTTVWKTKGDANDTEDEAIVPAEKLVGIYQRRIAGAGNIAMFMQTTKGLIICVICPIILLVMYDIIRRRIYEKKNEKDTEQLLKELEELRKEKDKNISKR